MARTSIRIPDPLLEDFDRKLCRLKAEGELPTDCSRSDALREIMSAWVHVEETECWPNWHPAEGIDYDFSTDREAETAD